MHYVGMLIKCRYINMVNLNIHMVICNVFYVLHTPGDLLLELAISMTNMLYMKGGKVTCRKSSDTRCRIDA